MLYLNHTEVSENTKLKKSKYRSLFIPNPLNPSQKKVLVPPGCIRGRFCPGIYLLLPYRLAMRGDMRFHELTDSKITSAYRDCGNL